MSADNTADEPTVENTVPEEPLIRKGSSPNTYLVSEFGLFAKIVHSIGSFFRDVVEDHYSIVFSLDGSIEKFIRLHKVWSIAMYTGVAVSSLAIGVISPAAGIATLGVFGAMYAYRCVNMVDKQLGPLENQKTLFELRQSGELDRVMEENLGISIDPESMPPGTAPEDVPKADANGHVPGHGQYV